MSREEILHIIHSHYKKLSKYFVNIKKHLRPEDIHQLRVEYKKLRAFLRMVSFLKTEEGKIKIDNQIKKVYRILGAIRDIQLQQLRLQENHKEQTRELKPYFRLLNKNLKKLRSHFSRLRFKRARKKSMQKNDTLVFNGITAQDFEIYTGHNWKIIDSIISSKEFTDSNIHKIRKFMKDIYYNTQVIKKLNARKTGSEDENINTKLQYFDKLLEDLGNFQDVCTSIELLDPHLLHSLNFSTQEFLAHIKKLFIDEKNAMKVSSVEKLADYSARNGSLIDDTTSEQQQLSVVQ